MREAINDNELEMVAGGAVCFSQARNRVSFSTLQQGFTIKGDYEEVRKYVIGKFAENPDMNEKEFDKFIKNALLDKGWI